MNLVLERLALVAGIVLSGSALCSAGEVFPLVDADKEAVLVGDARVVGLGYHGPRNCLQHYIKQSTGRKLKMVAEKDYDPRTMRYPVFVGNTAKARELFGEKLKKMDKDDYIVCVRPEFVVLVGASPLSSQWVQFDFLREYLGIDSYFPAKIGLVVPRHDRVLIPVETRIEVPVFRSRAFSAINSWRGLRSWGEIPWRMYRRFQFHHNIHRFTPVEEFGKTHPEYFPMVRGKRTLVSTSAGPGPCISNPEVVRIITRKVREYFDKNPERLTVSLGMTDGGWCECPGCKAMDGPSVEIDGDTAPKSQRYYLFLNQVARALQESHPGKMIGVLGYAGAEYPPKRVKVEPNIIPYLCYTRANWFDRAVREADLRSIDAWLERVDQIGIYEYLYGMGFSTPRIYNHYLAELLRYVAKRAKGRNIGFYAEIYSNHGLDGPKPWVTEKLLWNPEQDVDQLVRRWCVAVFKEAAPAMERYFNRLERIRIRNGPLAGNVRGKFALFRKDRQLLLFPPKDIEACVAELEQARKLARGEIVKRRIEYFASTFKITEIASRVYHAYMKANKLAAKGAPADQLLAALLEGDAKAPEENLQEYVEKIQKADRTKFLGGVEIAVSTDIAIRIINELCWAKVAEALKAGKRRAEGLIEISRQALRSHLPKDASESPVARKRVRDLLQMASRITVARKISRPPAIDGNPDDTCWNWVSHSPWFAWQSGKGFTVPTSFALAHDGRYLYLAVRCPQDDLKERRKCRGYGAPAWKYASVEFFINPDERDAEPREVPYYQVIAAYGGGLWENKPNVAAEYEMSSTEKEWRAELKIDLRAIGMLPSKYPHVRINFVRNIREGGHSGKAWFPSSGAHKDLKARGWLLFE